MKNNTAQHHDIILDIRGSSLLEFAIVLPVFALLLCAVIEFGWYFVRYDGLSRALSVTVSDMQNSGGPGATTQAIANGNGSGLIAFGTGGNYICAQAYQTNPNPNNTNPPPSYCANNTWITTGTCLDTGVACVPPYYVGIVAHAASMSLTGLVGTILPSGTSITEYAAPQVGMTSSSGGASGVVFVAPVTLATIPSSAAVAWTTVTGLESYGVPMNASALILATNLNAGNAQFDASINLRPTATGSVYELAGTRTSGGGAPNLNGFNQGIYPVSAAGGTLSFQYESTGSLGSSTIVLEGYMSPTTTP